LENTTLSDIAKTVADSSNIMSQALSAAKTLLGITDGDVEDEEVTLVVETYMDIKITDVKTSSESSEGASSSPEVTFDITPWYKITASTSSDDNLETTEVAINKLEIENTVPVTLPLPNMFNEDADLYVRHEKSDGTTYFYNAEKNTVDNTIKFNNPHGFSKFTITTENPAEATIGDVGYTTLAEAIAAVGNNGTVIVNKPDLSAEVSGDKTFTLSLGEEVTTAPSITAASGYTLSNSGNTYTVAPRRSSGGGGSTTTASNVTLPKSANGSVSISPSAPSKGSTVTITAKPNDGYKVDKITVTDKDGNAVEVKDNGNNKYSFTMLDGKVTVDASFVEDETVIAQEGEDNTDIAFTDVKSGDYFYNAVKWAVENDITNGMPDGSFAPSASCTRAQVATFLWRAAGSPDTADSANFADVQSGSYYEKAVAWAVANGITLGTGSDTFSPDAVCSRGQIVTFLARYADGKPSAESTRFSDVSSNDYFADSVQWALENKITEGTSAEKFSPYADCTRAQVVTFLYRYCNGVN
jgi:hypothetical protein